jgi:DNA-binding NtrC family response regulator
MILLIDDSDHERAMIRKMLESGGHAVSEAAGGDEGLALFGSLAPALVICDLMMPHKDGFATVADMQQLAPGAKIIAMSGVWFGKSDHDAMARNLGLVAVIEKPFERTQLLRLVANALNPAAKATRKAKAKSKAKPKRKAKAKPKAKAKAKRKAKGKAKPKARRKRR